MQFPASGDPLISGSFMNYVTAKVDGDGNFQWAASYKGATNWANATCIKVSPNGNVYVTGGSRWGNNGVMEYATIKYAQCPSKAILRNSVKPTENKPVSNLSKIYFYPNPAKDEFNIVYNGYASGQKIVASLYNIYGAKIKQIEVFNKNQFIVSTADISEGVYFCTVYLGNTIIGKDKMVIIK
jgi:hypothetical protein